MYVERSRWPECVDKMCYDEYASILLVDDLVDIRTNNSFRPSYPLGNISANVEVPVYLAQHQNAEWLLSEPGKYDCKQDGCCYIQINSKNETGTEFTCKGEIFVTDQLVGAKSKEIKGTQTRSIQCQWGERVCFGFSNQPDVEHFCDEYDVDRFFLSPSNCTYRAVEHVPRSSLEVSRRSIK